MNLVQAWNALADTVGLPDDPALRGAVKVLYEALLAVADDVRVGDAASDAVRDQVSHAFLALTRACRPRFDEDDPTSPAKIRRYLATTLKRRVLRAAKAARRELSVDADPELARAKEARTEMAHTEAALVTDLEASIEALRRHVVEPWADTRRAGRGDAIRRDFEEMLRLAIGQTTIADLLGDAVSGATTAMALHQRHSRTRKELRARVDALAGQALSREDAEVFRELLDLLRRTPSDTPRRMARGRA